MLGFDFEEERIKQEISTLWCQAGAASDASGPKTQGTEIAKTIERPAHYPIISLDPCYGACDIAVSEAEGLGADLVVHFGHAKMVKNPCPCPLRGSPRQNRHPEALHSGYAAFSNYKKIGLTTSIQHIDALTARKRVAYLLQAKRAWSATPDTCPTRVRLRLQLQQRQNPSPTKWMLFYSWAAAYSTRSASR